MLKKLSTALDLIENIFVVIACAILLIFTTGIIVEVLARTLFDTSFQWTIEYTEYALIFIPFLGAAWLLRKNGHITVDLIGELIPENVLYIVDKIILVVCLVITLLLTWYGTVVSIEYFEMNTRANTVLQTELVYIISIIPICSGVLFLEFIRKFYQSFKPSNDN